MAGLSFLSRSHLLNFETLRIQIDRNYLPELRQYIQWDPIKDQVGGNSE